MGLRRAYDGVASVIGHRRIESYRVAAIVEELRLAQRPDHVRVVVLAESHVWTAHEEADLRVAQPDGVETAFARFVYCLGYGEPHLMAPTGMRNSGTPQYWRLLHDALRGPGAPVAALQKQGEPRWRQRVLNKLSLLEDLRIAGVWLVDASVTALYRDGEKLAAGADYGSVLKTCWAAHVGDVVAGCFPSAVLIVGKGVDAAIGDAVRHDLGRDVEVATVNQPNARLSRTAIAADRRGCFELCERHRPARSRSQPLVSGLRRAALGSPVIAEAVRQQTSPQPAESAPSPRKTAASRKSSIAGTVNDMTSEGSSTEQIVAVLRERFPGMKSTDEAAVRWYQWDAKRKAAQRP